MTTSHDRPKSGSHSDNAFVMAVNGYGYEDIALVTGMTKATARKMVWDVREKMQAKQKP